MAHNFRLTVYKKGKTYIFKIFGNMDGSSAVEVGYYLEKLGPSRVLLDFSQVRRVDPFGTKVLALRLKALKSSRYCIFLTGLSRDSMGIFKKEGVEGNFIINGSLLYR